MLEHNNLTILLHKQNMDLPLLMSRIQSASRKVIVVGCSTCRFIMVKTIFARLSIFKRRQFNQSFSYNFLYFLSVLVSIGLITPNACVFASLPLCQLSTQSRCLSRSLSLFICFVSLVIIETLSLSLFKI